MYILSIDRIPAACSPTEPFTLTIDVFAFHSALSFPGKSDAQAAIEAGEAAAAAAAEQGVAPGKAGFHGFSPMFPKRGPRADDFRGSPER